MRTVLTGHDWIIDPHILVCRALNGTSLRHFESQETRFKHSGGSRMLHDDTITGMFSCTVLTIRDANPLQSIAILDGCAVTDSELRTIAM